MSKNTRDVLNQRVAKGSLIGFLTLVVASVLSYTPTLGAETVSGDYGLSGECDAVCRSFESCDPDGTCHSSSNPESDTLCIGVRQTCEEPHDWCYTATGCCPPF